jgi:type III restriction enzyme
MSKAFIDNPVINSPFRSPEWHWLLNDDGSPTGVKNPGRRRSEHLMPIPAPRKRKGAQQGSLGLEERNSERLTPNPLVNLIREQVGRWRQEPKTSWGVTPATAQLLKHWRDMARDQPLFFCQVEAIETVIWLEEVAPGRSQKHLRDELKAANAEANPDLFRLAMKMATGTGKTTVMAMLIAWQVLNQIRYPRRQLFSDSFLIVAPGITIRDRLRVLLPSDPNNYYAARDIVPEDMRADMGKAQVVIANYHQFKRRERLEASKLTKGILAGRDERYSTRETEGEMVMRVCREFARRKNIVVMNDEAHHCYRHKVRDAEDEKLTGDDRTEASRREEAARIWISGLEAVNRVLGLRAVYDLSATPFFLRGSGYPEGTLFPWVVSDFSLMEAIEAGIVKVPRVPVSDDTLGSDLPKFRDLWAHIGKDMPKKGRAKQQHLDPEDLPALLLNAIDAFYGHYEKVFAAWQAQGAGNSQGNNSLGTPPVFIVVCNNTSTSKLVYDYIAGYRREEGGQERWIAGKCPLFSNVEEEKPLARPRTLLIDSEQLDSGETMTADFKKVAAAEIDAFKTEYRIRFPDRDVEKLTDEDLLREVMNTVGKPGQLGEQVRCVVSVSMLTEGWDANTVTHVLGVRAFGTQLLCEQVVGRALRRVSYEANDKGMFAPEYADVLGIPFTFVASPTIGPPQPPKPRTRIHALEERTGLEIRFPRVEGYRVTFPTERLPEPRFTENSRLTLDPDDLPSRTDLEAIIGEGITLTQEALKARREREVAFHVAGHALRTRFRDSEDNIKPFLFPQLLRITRAWMEACLEVKGDALPQYLLYRERADEAVERIYNAVAGGIHEAGEARLRPILAAYNPEGSTRHVDFFTTKDTLFRTSVTRCHVDFVVCDSDWEAHFADTVEHMDEVLAYVKNHNLGFEVPYVHEGEERHYRPDYILRVDDGRGADDPLNLVVEVKGYRGRDVQAKSGTMESLWIPAVNNHGGFGRWAFLEIRDPHEAAGNIRAFLAARQPRVAA